MQTGDVIFLGLGTAAEGELALRGTAIAAIVVGAPLVEVTLALPLAGGALRASPAG